MIKGHLGAAQLGVPSLFLFFFYSIKEKWEIMKRIADLYPWVRGIDFLLQLITVMFFRTEMISVSSFVITNDVQGHRLHDNLTTGDGLTISDLFSNG